MPTWPIYLVCATAIAVLAGVLVLGPDLRASRRRRRTSNRQAAVHAVTPGPSGSAAGRTEPHHVKEPPVTTTQQPAAEPPPHDAIAHLEAGLADPESIETAHHASLEIQTHVNLAVYAQIAVGARIRSQAYADAVMVAAIAAADRHGRTGRLAFDMLTSFAVVRLVREVDSEYGVERLTHLEEVVQRLQPDSVLSPQQRFMANWWRAVVAFDEDQLVALWEVMRDADAMQAHFCAAVGPSGKRRHEHDAGGGVGAPSRTAPRRAQSHAPPTRVAVKRRLDGQALLAVLFAACARSRSMTTLWAKQAGRDLAAAAVAGAGTSDGSVRL